MIESVSISTSDERDTWDKSVGYAVMRDGKAEILMWDRGGWYTLSELEAMEQAEIEANS